MNTIYHTLLMLYTAMYVVVILHHLFPLFHTRHRKSSALFILTVSIMLLYSWTDIHMISGNSSRSLDGIQFLLFRISFILSCLTCALWLSLINELLNLRLQKPFYFIWALTGLTALLAWTPLVITSTPESTYNAFGNCWYHGFEMGLFAAPVSGTYLLLMLGFTAYGLSRWNSHDIAGRFFAVFSAAVAVIAVLDILVFYQLLTIMFTWPLCCALFALASSLRLGGKHFQTAVELEGAQKELRDFHARSIKDQRLSTIGMIVHGIVHDMKNFFHITETLSQAGLEAAEEDDKEEIRQSFVQISESAADAHEYLKNMLAMTEETEQLEMQDIVLLSEVHRVVKVCGLYMQDPRIEVKIAINSKLTVYTDPRVLQQIILNLTFNAINALPTDPGKQRYISFIGEKTDAETVLHIEDSGPGLPKHATMVLDRSGKGVNISAKGIGLRLILQGCQQLSIGLSHMDVTPGPGTRITLKFPDLWPEGGGPQ